MALKRTLSLLFEVTDKAIDKFYFSNACLNSNENFKEN